MNKPYDMSNVKFTAADPRELSAEAYPANKTALELLDQYERPIKSVVRLDVYDRIVEQITALNQRLEAAGKQVIENDKAAGAWMQRALTAEDERDKLLKRIDVLQHNARMT